MSVVQIQGNAAGTGTLTIAAPNTNNTQVLTLPDNTGTLLSTASTFGGTGPAFSAYLSTNQNIASGTQTPLNIASEDFDTNNCFNNTGSTVTLNGVSVPAYAFGPNVAGYYQVYASVYPNTSTTFAAASIYKNASVYKSVQTQASNVGVEVSCIVYLNGTSDYIQFYGYLTGTSPQVYSSNVYTFFQAALVRAA
jgi:hypothetical protein